MNYKQQSARRALDFVQNGMVLGLGTGSTTTYFIDLLAENLRSGQLKNIVAVPTSQKTLKHAQSSGIPITSLSNHSQLDIAVDGADEVDGNLNLIKGLGLALLREKIVAVHAEQLIIIVDESKIVSRLGSKGPLPVELIEFEYAAQINWLNSLGCNAELWLKDGGSPIVTDNGNYTALCSFKNGISDPYKLADILANRPGIVEHGLFLDITDKVIVAGSTGIQIMENKT